MNVTITIIADARNGANIIKLASFALLTLALCAAQLWPSLEFANLSVRARVDYDFVSGGFPLHRPHWHARWRAWPGGQSGIRASPWTS